MALITCPECNGQVSDKADVCPHCGYPIREQPHRQTESNAEQAGNVDRQFCIDRIHAGKVYIRCKCGCTIEKPFSFVSRNSQESYTLNETLICPQCHAEALARTDLTNVPSKRIAVPSPRYGNAASGVCPFCGKPNIQAVKKRRWYRQGCRWRSATWPCRAVGRCNRCKQHSVCLPLLRPKME